MNKLIYDSTGRETYIDVMKGIGILLLILSHSIPGESTLKTWIFSFHMPLFFWCSGWLFALKAPKKDVFRKTLKVRIYKKARAILIPYVVFSLAIITYQVLIQFVHDGSFDRTMLFDNLLRIVELRGMESLWFLPCLLLAELAFFFIYAYFSKNAMYVVALIGVVACFFINGHVPAGIIGTFARTVTSLLFVAMGYFSYAMWATWNKQFQWPWVIYGICIIAGAGIALRNGFAAIGICEFGNVLLFFLSAFLTLNGLVGLCKLMPTLKVISFYGKDSVVVLCTNNIIIEIVRLIDSKLCGNTFLSHGMIGNLMFAIVIAIIEFPVIIIGMKYFSVLFGNFSKARAANKS